MFDSHALADTVVHVPYISVVVHGVDYTVSDKVKRNPIIESMQKKAAWKPEEDKRLVEMRDAGAAWPLIAKELNRTQAATENRAFVLRRRRAALAEPSTER